MYPPDEDDDDGRLNVPHVNSIVTDGLCIEHCDHNISSYAPAGADLAWKCNGTHTLNILSH